MKIKQEIMRQKVKKQKKKVSLEEIILTLRY